MYMTLQSERHGHMLWFISGTFQCWSPSVLSWCSWAAPDEAWVALSSCSTPVRRCTPALASTPACSGSDSSPDLNYDKQIKTQFFAALSTIQWMRLLLFSYSLWRNWSTIGLHAIRYSGQWCLKRSVFYCNRPDCIMINWIANRWAFPWNELK